MSPSANISTMSSGHDAQADLRADMDVLNQEDTPLSGQESEDTEEAPPKPPKPAKPGEEEEEEPEGTGDEESEEGSEEEEEEEAEPEAEPQAISIHPRPTVSDIKSKYPQFFKDFPDMRHMLFREGEYSKLFPTIEDAKEAQSSATDFGHLRDLITSGTQEQFVEFLGGVKEAGGLESMVANFLPSLYKMDKDTYFNVTSPIAESLLRNAYKAAQASGNENLVNAALHLAQWAFNDTGYATGEKATPELKPKAEGPKDAKYEQEKSDFYKTRYTETQTYVGTNSKNRLVAEVRKGLDPNNAFKPFTQNLLVKQILEEIGDTLQADAPHMATMNSLWKQANKAGFAGDWKDRILSAYLSRAKQVMPGIRSRIRAAAMADEESGTRRLERRADLSSERRDVTGSQSRGGPKNTGRPPAASEIDWKSTSDMDILNDKPTLRTRK